VYKLFEYNYQRYYSALSVNKNCESPKDSRHCKYVKNYKKKKKHRSASFDCIRFIYDYTVFIHNRVSLLYAYKSAIIAILRLAKCQERFSPVTIIIKYVFLFRIRCEQIARRTVCAVLEYKIDDQCD